MKLYRVQDVRRYTGLTRKQLFSYEKSIPPVERIDNGDVNEDRKGYKLYDVESLDKLSIAALLSNLGAGPKKINKLFEDSAYDKSKLFDEIIEEAEIIRGKMDDIITVATELKKFGLNNIIINPLQTYDLHKFAEAIRAEYSSVSYKNFINILSNHEQELLNYCNEIYKLDDDNEEYPICRNKIINNLVNYIHYDLKEDNWNRFLYLLAINLCSADGVKRYCDQIYEPGFSEKVGMILFDYIVEPINNEMLDEICVCKQKLLEKQYNDPEVKKAIEKFLNVTKKQFGIDNDDELDNILNTFKKLFFRVTDGENEFDLYVTLYNVLFEGYHYYKNRT